MIENNTTIESRFMRTGSLTRVKLMEYIPVMILTNMSVFLLSTVDGLVAGNLISSQALASINIFYPAMIAVTVISSVVDSGSATSLSTSMGTNDIERIRRTKSAVKRVMIVAALFVAVAQIPIIYVVISSYGLTPEMEKMCWEYAIGVMIALPVGIISSVGSYQLQIIGRMRVLMVLSIVESLSNLALDLFFVQVMHLGLMGIGFGTAVANLIRCSATVIYLMKKTDVYQCGGVGAHWKEVKDILFCGLPDAASMFMVAWQNYFIMRVILEYFGDEGGTIKGVCFFAFNIATMMILGVQKSMRPLLGLYAGAGDKKEMQSLMRECMIICCVLVSIVILAVELFPGLVYRVNGVDVIPENGILSLRLFVLYFIFKGMDDLFRPYFANRKDSLAATGLTIFGNATLPVFAKILGQLLSAPFIWLGYLTTELLIFVLSQLRYRWWRKKDQKESDTEKTVLYLAVKPEEAVEASRMIRQYAKENGVEEKIAYRMALCMEEMVAYAVQSQKDPDIQIQIMTQFRQGEGVFFMMDNGECLALNENAETQELITDNYTLLKKVSKSVEYQYILNLNYTIFRF